MNTVCACGADRGEAPYCPKCGRSRQGRERPFVGAAGLGAGLWVLGVIMVLSATSFALSRTPILRDRGDEAVNDSGDEAFVPFEDGERWEDAEMGCGGSEGELEEDDSPIAERSLPTVAPQPSAAPAAPSRPSPTPSVSSRRAGFGGSSGSPSERVEGLSPPPIVPRLPSTLTRWPASRYQAASSVPGKLTRMLMVSALKRRGHRRFSELWGKSPYEVGLSGREPLEVKDSRPWQLVYEVPLGVRDRTRRKLYLRWLFVDRQLYALRLRLRRKVRRLRSTVTEALGRGPDEEYVAYDMVEESRWFDGDLVLTVRYKRKQWALDVADRARLAPVNRKRSLIHDAERAVIRGAAQFYGHTSDYDQAIAYMEAAIDDIPNFGDAWSNLCHVYYELRRFDEARRTCNRAMAVTGERSVKGEANYYLSLMALVEGDRRTGISLMKAALDMMPAGWTASRQARARLQLISGHLTHTAMKRAIYDLECYRLRGYRSTLIPAEYGQESVEALLELIIDRPVDTTPDEERASRTCTPR